MQEKCNNFNECNASICPLSTDTEKLIWYPDEDICNSQNFTQHPMVKAQKKIVKKAKNNDTYFLTDMLIHQCVIKKNILGIDPDKDEETQLIQWFKGHHILNNEVREKRREQIVRSRLFIGNKNLKQPVYSQL